MFLSFKLHPRNLGWNSGMHRILQCERRRCFQSAVWILCMKFPPSILPLGLPHSWGNSYLTELPISPPRALTVSVSVLNWIKMCKTWVEEQLGLERPGGTRSSGFDQFSKLWAPWPWPTQVSWHLMLFPCMLTMSGPTSRHVSLLLWNKLNKFKLIKLLINWLEICE